MDLTKYDIIKKPVISDKAYRLSKRNKVVVVVHQDANASEIKKAAERLFGIKIEKVNVIKRPGKTKRVAGGRRLIKGQDQKRAVLTLAAGYTLDLFGHVTGSSANALSQQEVNRE